MFRENRMLYASRNFLQLLVKSSSDFKIENKIGEIKFQKFRSRLFISTECIRMISKRNSYHYFILISLPILCKIQVFQSTASPLQFNLNHEIFFRNFFSKSRHFIPKI